MIWVYVLLTVILIAAGLGYVKKKEIELEASFRKRFASKNVLFMDKHALFVAQQSDGYSHVRGAGHLVLTDEELYYKRQFGNKVISIPLSSIVHVGQTRRLAGQSPGRSMLKVAFTTLRGQEDAVAWRVNELQRWIDEISAAIGNK